MPDYCTVTGTVYHGNALVAGGKIITISPLGATGETVSSKTDKAISDLVTGVISFRAIRGSGAILKGRVYVNGTWLGDGVTVTIPSAENATLTSLISQTTIPSEGLTIKVNGVAVPHKAGTLNFVGDVDVDEVSAGEVDITITAGGGASALNDLSDVILTSPASNDFLQYNGSAWVNSPIAVSEVSGLSATLSGLASDISTLNSTKQPLDATLTALAALGFGAHQIAYSTASDTFSLTSLTAYGRSLIGVADEAAFKALVNLEIGTDVQGFNSSLSQLAGLADPNADRLLFWDESANSYAYLQLGTNLSITGTTLDASGGGGGANQSLSNLTDPTAINQDLLFAAGKNLGSRLSAPSEAFFGNPDEATGQGFYFMPFFTSSEQVLFLGLSSDGINWSRFGPVYTPPSGILRDPAIIRHNQRYWMVYTRALDATSFSLATSDDLINWTFQQNIAAGADITWAPEWFIDDDGSIHVFVSVLISGAREIVEVHPTNEAMTAWSSGVTVTGLTTDHKIDPFIIKKDGLYHLWYCNNAGGSQFVIEYASSSSLTSGYTTTQSGDWAGWGPENLEAVHLVKINSSTWRIYFDNIGTGIYYSESTDDWETWSEKEAISVEAGTTAVHPTVMKVNDYAMHRNLWAGLPLKAGYARLGLNNTFTGTNIFTRPFVEAQSNRAAYRFNDGTGAAGIGQTSDLSTAFYNNAGTEILRVNSSGFELPTGEAFSFVNPGVAFLGRIFAFGTDGIRIGRGFPGTDMGDINLRNLYSGGTKVVGAQQAFIADPSGGATQDAEARTAITAILDALIAHGLIAAS